MTGFQSTEVAAAFAAFPPAVQAGTLRLRDLILHTARDLPQAQPLRETLKWGQPAYLAPRGSTLRLGPIKAGTTDQNATGRFALFVHCQSRLIPEFLDMFPGQDRIQGTRAVLFDRLDQIDTHRHGWLIARALTYHLPT